MKPETKDSAAPDMKDSSPVKQKSGFDWFYPVSVALIVVFAVNACIVYFLLVAIPADCARIANETAGMRTCGIEPGAYVISAICLVLVIVSLVLFVKWNLGRCRT